MGRGRALTVLVATGSLGLAALPASTPSVLAAPPTVRSVPAGIETTPTTHTGDSADDPALWVDPDDPADSLLIGNDKQGALEVYGLDGELRQQITTATAFWGNVDVRRQVSVGDEVLDVVAAYNGGLRFYTVDPQSHDLVPVTDAAGAIPTGGGEGLCLYQRPQGDAFAYVITRKGKVMDFRLHDDDHDGLVNATRIRQFALGSEAEGCVADDRTGALYVSQEDVALWRYDAGPTGGVDRTAVDTVTPDGRLAPDIEGVTVAGDHLIVSAQNVRRPKESYFAVYDRDTNAYEDAFRISQSATTDGCQRTDGITAYAGDLGPSFPAGVFVCQDNFNGGTGADGNQDFKLTRLDVVFPG